MLMRRIFVAGNWKMNTDRADAVELAGGLAERHSESSSVDVLIAPPFVWLEAVAEAIHGSGVLLAGQNAWCEPSGAYTGEVSCEMLAEVGCGWVILGHSERRQLLGDTDELVSDKVTAAHAGGLDVILCVGETREQREASETEAVLSRQLLAGLAAVDTDTIQRLVVAYEPVWAIGTGLTATTLQAESAHAHLRNQLAVRYNSEVAESTRILYGGSVNSDNAAELMSQPNVDGALVGGASLSVESFVAIIEAAREL
jgi:triosephosphate isomerase